jgi:outer membrane protein assembly factor BamB/tetratricopeptide (TPR) repeat protein
MRSAARGHLGEPCRSGGIAARAIIAAVIAAAVALPRGEVRAQVPRRIAAPNGQAGDKAPVRADWGAVLHPSEEATTLLERAREGESRQDWKLVVDSLQRIIELPGDHVLATHATKYESARLHAQRQLGKLPPDGLRAYRLIYDGEAQSIFKQALDRHDEAALRGLVDRSLLTSVGDDAAVTLADWLIDQGRFVEAGALLRLVQSAYPDSDLPAWVVPLRLAVCLAGMNRSDEARALLDELAAQPAGNAPGVAPRIEQVRQYMRGVTTTQPEETQAGWPMAYGRSARDGRMAVVEPTFISHLPWNVPLPVPTPRTGVGAVQDYAAENGLMPAADLATDGRVLVVKSGTNLLGLDVATFDPIWATRSDQEDTSLVELESTMVVGQGWTAGQGTRQDRLADDSLIRCLYYDAVGNQVCLAADLATTVEWPGDPPNTLAMRRDRGLRQRGIPVAGSGQTQPNFVVAYSLADGHRVWTSDTASGSHALGPVEFLAAPMAVEGLLLVPCRVNDDLYAVLLDPATGRIARHIYLCGTGGAPFDSLYACTPCAADGTVFIPTGRGVVAAVDVANWSIRWVIRYDHAAEPANQMTWWPSPAIAVSNVVLVAPPDADSLFCIDRSSGDIRWQAPREKAQYVIAATDRMVWTAGKQVRAIDLQSGKPAWSRECGLPAGRAAKSGDRVYVPTYDGLFVLDAHSGNEIESQPVATVPPGNLLAYDGSLYVASPFEIRKYPDMKRGYDQARLACRANPGDPSLAMRLAWLEYLNNRPAEALAALSGVPDTLRQRDAQRYARLSHLRVLAMLEQAATPGMASDQAIRLLAEARQAAPNPQDAITARLALGDYLNRSQDASMKLQAALEYAALALEATGDEVMSEDGDTGSYQRRAVLLASRRLEDATRTLPAEQIERLTAFLNKRLGEAIAGRDIPQLRRMSNCSALTRLSMQADMALAIWAARDLAYEQAEACLQRVLSRAQSPDLLAEAAARLAVIYLQPAELHLPVTATGLLRRLEGEFAAVQLSADILEPEWAAPTLPGSTVARTIPAVEVARLLRKRIDNNMLARHEAALGRIMVGSPGKPPRTADYPKSRPIVLRGPRSETLTDRMLLLAEDRTVEARRIDNGEVLWPAELRLLGEMIVESQTVNESIRVVNRGSYAQPARGVASGQTLVLNTRFGVHAVGLLTGRRLWSRRFDPPGGAEQEATASDAWVWSAEGYVASVDNFGWLEVARCESGADVLWRRRMVQRPWQTVRIFGNYLVAGDARLERIDVFSLNDGTYLGQCQFVQPQGEAAVNIAVAGDTVCGPVSDREVVAFELKTPGVERWRLTAKTDLAQIFKPSADLVAVADRGGRLQVIDPATGSAKLNAEVPACGQGVIDGRLGDDILYVYGLARRQENNRPMPIPQEWAVAAVRMSDGQVVWSKQDLGAQLPLTGDVLEASSNAIPLLVFRPAAGQNRVIVGDDGAVVPPSAGRGKVELILLDKATGKALGEKVVLESEPGDSSSMLLDLQVWPDEVAAFVGTQYVRFRLSGPASSKPGS